MTLFVITLQRLEVTPLVSLPPNADVSIWCVRKTGTSVMQKKYELVIVLLGPHFTNVWNTDMLAAVSE